MKKIWNIIIIVLVLTGCEKIIDLPDKNHETKIVIEANISNQPGPYFVKISRSVALGDVGDHPTVNDAIVKIADDAGNSETLSFAGNGIYQTNSITGVPGRTYNLTVNVAGETYTAQSSMPAMVSFDSIKVLKQTVLGEVEYNLVPKYKDPAAKGNNYRFVVNINHIFYPHHLLLTDELQNGVENTLRLEMNDEDYKLNEGDSVQVSMQCIDKTAARFYTALILMSDNGPGGSTTPDNPPGNFSNGALGLFSAHTIETRNVMVR